VKATRTLKDLGFKVNYHMMPGLPGSSIEKDSQMLRKIFDDDRFRPDMLKIYPCMVVPGSKLDTVWEAGRFSPMSTEDAVSLIAGWKPMVPEYCRIMRVQRDIPSNAIAAGVDRTNLRQIIQSKMKEKGLFCRCIRCREVGRNASRATPKLKTIEYPASGGTEFFISYETEKALFGFCRLRLPGQALTKEFNKVTAIIRELHVYGEAAEIGQSGIVQHKGLGKKLVKEAERIASANRSERMLVISGIGARDYYRKLGYRRLGHYMAKGLSVAE
jgi:elongator complex protein 3